MSEAHPQCDRFDRWLAGGRDAPESPGWSEHVEKCEACQAQWEAHRMLSTAFADEPVPDLSPAFEAGLERKLDAAIEIRPLAGWRRAAMLGYLVAGVGGLGWLLRDSPLWTVPLDSPWLTGAAFAAVPLTFLLAIAASRWMPAPRGAVGPRALAL